MMKCKRMRRRRSQTKKDKKKEKEKQKGEEKNTARGSAVSARQSSSTHLREGWVRMRRKERFIDLKLQ